MLERDGTQESIIHVSHHKTAFENLNKVNDIIHIFEQLTKMVFLLLLEPSNCISRPFPILVLFVFSSRYCLEVEAYHLILACS